MDFFDPLTKTGRMVLMLFCVITVAFCLTYIASILFA